MGLNLAKTTFATAADENLVAVDAYAVKSAQKIQNNRRDPLDQMSVQGLLGLNGGNLSANLQLITKKGLGIQVNAQGLLQGIMGSNPALKAAYSSASDAVKSGISYVQGGIAQAQGMVSGAISQVQATINGVTSSIAGANLSDLKSVAGMIGGLAGGQYGVTLTDITGLSNVSASLIIQGSSMGLPDVYTTISVGLNNNKVMNKATSMLAPYIINNSASGLLGQVANSPYRGQLTAQRPNFVKQYSQNYRKQPGANQAGYRQTLGGLSSSFTKVDTSWKKSKAFGGPSAGTLNLNSAWQVSDDFDDLLKANAAYASVPVPTSNYAQMNTSCSAAPSNAPYDVELAQAGALKSAFPVSAQKQMLDPLQSLQESFPLVLL